MKVTFPINELLKKGLTADDYTIAVLIQNKKYGLLKSYLNTIGNKFYDSLKRLKELGYIDFNTVGNVIPIKEAHLTDEFDQLTLNGSNFDEFYNAYPKSTHRVDGNYAYLRDRKAQCKVKYNRLVGKNLMVHDHIMDCLNWEVNRRTQKGDLAYMKTMYNWLNSEHWKEIEERREHEKQAKQSQLNSYGTNVR